MHQWEKKSHSEKINGKLFNDRLVIFFLLLDGGIFSRRGKGNYCEVLLVKIERGSRVGVSYVLFEYLQQQMRSGGLELACIIE